jgi:hypothetical protein
VDYRYPAFFPGVAVAGRAHAGLDPVSVSGGDLGKLYRTVPSALGIPPSFFGTYGVAYAVHPHVYLDVMAVYSRSCTEDRRKGLLHDQPVSLRA